MKQKQKYKKKSKKLLLFDYNQLTREEMLATVKEIIERLFKHFKHHIGSENSTTPHEIFVAIIGIEPDDVSIYKREYWWNVIKSIMSKLRSSEDIFIIHRGTLWFVLQTQQESNQYKEILDRSILAMQKGKVKADKWVRNKSWRNI